MLDNQAFLFAEIAYRSSSGSGGGVWAITPYLINLPSCDPVYQLGACHLRTITDTLLLSVRLHYCLESHEDPGRMQRISRELIERAARLYSSNKAASAALGPTAFARACRRYGIKTPYARRRESR